MVAAMCMVLYGYDASVFNSVQGSNNWLAWFDLDAVSCYEGIPALGQAADSRILMAKSLISRARKPTRT